VTNLDAAVVEEFIAAAERLTEAARALITPGPGAVSPAKARLQRFPVAAKS
jgi:hypothetical protein